MYLFVKCVFCLFVATYKDILGYRSSGKIRVASRRCTAVPVAQHGGGKKTNSNFLRVFVRCVPLFRSLMWTPMIYAYSIIACNTCTPTCMHLTALGMNKRTIGVIFSFSDFPVGSYDRFGATG